MIEATYWVPHPWGLTNEKRAPFAGRRAFGNNGKGVGSLDLAQEEHKNTSLLLKQGRERRLKLKPCGWLTGFL